MHIFRLVDFNCARTMHDMYTKVEGVRVLRYNSKCFRKIVLEVINKSLVSCVYSDIVDVH